MAARCSLYRSALVFAVLSCTNKTLGLQRSLAACGLPGTSLLQLLAAVHP